MAYKVDGLDNIRESFTSSGTTITLGGAVPNSRAFSSGLSSGDTFTGVARKGAEVSVGKFTYTTGSIAQTEVWYSTNGNAAVSFSSGGDAGEVFPDVPSRLFDHLNMAEITVTSAATFDIGAPQGKFIRASGTTGPVTSLGNTTTNKERVVRWAGATLTCNTTSLILIGLANGATRVTVDGDIGIYKQDGSGNWRELDYVRKDGRPLLPTIAPSFAVNRNNVDQTAIVTSTFTKVQFTTEEFDTNSNFDNATNYRFTPTVAGKYLITFNTAYASIADGKTVLAAIYKNGTAYKYGIPAPFGATGAGGAGVAHVIDFNGSTDYVEFFTYHEHGSNRDMSGNTLHSFASGHWISP